MNKIYDDLKMVLDETKERRHKDMAWLKEYHADLSHIAAGEALAAAALTATVLGGDMDIVRRLLCRRDNRMAGNEDFRFAFARVLLEGFLNNMREDNMVFPELPEDKVQQLQLMLETLAYDGGELARKAGKIDYSLLYPGF